MVEFSLPAELAKYVIGYYFAIVVIKKGWRSR